LTRNASITEARRVRAFFIGAAKMNKRAYSTLTVKAMDDGKRKFSGIASTPSTDRMGDIVEPKGAQFKLPIPLLWMHDASDPVGWVTSAKVTSAGIEIEGEIADLEEEGDLKKRLDMAWQQLKAGLVRALSIGFNPIESARIDGTYGYRFLKWEWLELSAVTIPANQDATIFAIKSIDQAVLAASGRKAGWSRPGVSPPGVSGIQSKAASGGFFYSRSGKENAMKTMQQVREERETKSARMREILDGQRAENRASTDDEAAEFDTLAGEVKGLDDDLRRMQFDAMNAGTAKAVDGMSADGASRSRSGPTIIVRGSDTDEAFKGQNYVRRIIAKALAHIEGGGVQASGIAQARWGKSAPTLVRLIKANEVSGGSSDTWGSELVSADNRYTGDFIEYLYGATVYDKLPLRQIPANVAIKGQDGVGTGYWVGESKPIPVTTGDFSTVSLTPLKVGALAVVSNELLRDSTPAAEMLVRDILVQASAQRIDTTFISKTAASAGVSPAGILNGVTGSASAGTDAAGLRSDIKALYRNFITAKNASGLYLVMHPAQAKAISLLVNSLGQTEFPGLGAMGGTLLGDPVVTGDNVAANDIVLLKPSDIYRIADGGVEVSISREATIEQSTVPSGATDTPVAAAQYMTNMFQSESTAIKVVRSINFAKRRSTAVAFIENADYDGVQS